MRAWRKWFTSLVAVGLVMLLLPLGDTRLLAQSATATPQADPPAREDPAQNQTDLERAAANQGLSPDRLIVLYEASTAATAGRAQVRAQAGGVLLHADQRLSFDVVRVPGGDAPAAAARLRGIPGVRDAYADHLVSASLVVNDPLLSDQWGLAKIQAPAAWDTSRAAGVPIAVVDCGIHTSHPDLAGKVTLEQNFSASTTTDDRCNHGTHVAGIAGALTNNAAGVAGAAPAATLYNAKVLSDTGTGFMSDVDLAIQWAADNGAKVINLSLAADGIACPSGTQAAANYAWSKGAVLVAAAGNTGSSAASTPANCQNVIGVAATDTADGKASWSSYGAAVALAAPGVGIVSTVNPDVNGGALYATLSGTSMAAPHVAAVAALLWQTGFGAGPASVRDQLFASADAIAGTGTLWTYGRVNAARAVAPVTVATATSIATSVPTSTSAPSSTNTPAPAPSLSPTATLTATATSTAVLSATPTATLSATPTSPATPSPTATGTAIPTRTPRKGGGHHLTG